MAMRRYDAAYLNTAFLRPPASVVRTSAWFARLLASAVWRRVLEVGQKRKDN